MNSEGSSQDINETFNQHLKQQIEGHLPKSYVYQIGYPNENLQSTGIPCLPIELSADRLAKKSKQDNHPFDLACVSNLPRALLNPIAIFDSTKGNGAKTILTELSNVESNFIVVISIHHKGRGRSNIEVNDITSLYPKDHVLGIIDWINGDLMKWRDKEKALKFISVQWPNYIGNGNKSKDFYYAAKIVNNFENPQKPIPERILQEKIKPIVKITPPKKGRRI